MSQLQSLHLHIQALVLTELDLDSPIYQSGPMCFAPHAQWSLPLSPHLGLEVLPLSPGNLVLTLPFPEHPTLPAKIPLDLRPRASGWHGVALILCVAWAFVIQKISWRGSLTGVLIPPFCIRSRPGPYSSWDQKHPEH